MPNNRWLAPFINLGHFIDHLAMLVFPTVVLALARDWDRPYSELLPLTLGGFIAFGAFALPAGWLADHWSRYRMMVVFFLGVGAALFLTGFANSPWQVGLGLTLVGVFAAIYHPVGIAMLVAAPTKLGAALGWNGLYGNLGLAAAALISGALVAVVYTLAAFAQLAMGALIDRFELRRLMIGIALVQIPLLAIAANLQGWAMLVGALAMMLAVFGQIPLNDAIVGKYCADEYRARVLAVRYVVSLGVAAVAGPLIAVLHRTEGGFRNVFLVLAALAAGMLAASLFFPARPVEIGRAHV